MKKKFLILVLAITMIRPISAHADEKDDKIAELEAQVAEMQKTIDDLQEENAALLALFDATSESDSAETPERDLPEGNYTDMGNGSLYISTASGTSENGNVPVIMAEKDLLVTQIGLNSSDMDGSKISFIYIDGILNKKEQLSTTQTSVDLSGFSITEGVHKIEVIQYDSDEPDGSIVTYKTASYEIQSL